MVSTGTSYTHGYSKAAVQEMERRTADLHAAFILSRLKTGSSVLDCGCGPGSITIGLAQHASSSTVTGIDLDPTQIQLAEHRAEQQSVSNVRFSQADVCDLPFPDEAFDTVFSNAVLEHVQRSDIALREMFRVLKRGGTVGLRHSVVSSRVWSPPAPESVKRAEKRWVEHWREAGGDPDFGLSQTTLLEATGFTEIVTSTSSHHLDRQQLKKRCELGGEAGFMTPLTQFGVPVEEVPLIARDFDHWLNNEAACNAMLLMESVATKPILPS